jgi:C_GCAxxG_C_C family probable redox protein
MNKIENTLSLFNRGFNCAQALLATYGIEFGIQTEIAYRIAAPFGGGIGRMGDICGAVTGAFMIIGLKYGNTSPNQEDKTAMYNMVEQFVNRFKEHNQAHSIMCRELLGFDISKEGQLSDASYRIIGRKCPEFVKIAAQIIEEIL